jgi:hypothetical protein
VLSLQHLEESLDPTIELTRLVSEGKLEEAFNKALSLSNVAIVSWLCMQVWTCKFLPIHHHMFYMAHLMALTYFPQAVCF